MCLVILKFLSTLADSEWDCEAVMKTVNIIVVIDRVLEKLSLTMQQPISGLRDSFFSLLQNLLAKCREWAMTSMSHRAAEAESSSSSGTLSARATPLHCTQTMPELGQMTSFQSMDLANDEWFEELISGEGFGF